MPTFSFPSFGAGAATSRFLQAQVGGIGGTATSRILAGGAAAGPPAADAGLLERITESITSNQALAAQNEASARASATQAEGYQREAAAYGTVGAIAENNATYEGIAGNIRQLQAARSVQRTIGRQRAQTASAGFASVAGSLDIMRASMQEGYLQDQLIRSQTSINQGGYFQQRDAAQASGEGARLASDAAMELSRGYATAGQLATSTAAQQTDALRQYLSSTGGVNDPTRALVTSTLDLGDDPLGGFSPQLNEFMRQGQQQIRGGTPDSLIGMNWVGSRAAYNPKLGA